ncbi:MAG: hypothetical protein Q8Q08_12790 [Candidatus Omnitrophota bacterium]|nr:hypothetical protein [Candidatus Omnitrophota bacterium]
MADHKSVLTDAQIKAAYERNSDTNEFADADRTKLDGIEALAEVNPTNAETKTAYEANADTNAFTDAEQTKLAGIEALADVTDAANVAAAGALMADQDLADLTSAATARDNLGLDTKADPGALTNSLGDTNVDGTLEAFSGLSTISIPALERNLSELNAKINALRTVLTDLDLIA